MRTMVRVCYELVSSKELSYRPIRVSYRPIRVSEGQSDLASLYHPILDAAAWELLYISQHAMTAEWMISEPAFE